MMWRAKSHGHSIPLSQLTNSDVLLHVQVRADLEARYPLETLACDPPQGYLCIEELYTV